MSFLHRTFRLSLLPGTDPEEVIRAFAGSDASTVLRHDWTPNGVTLVAVTASSTWVLHTWPERGFGTVDVIVYEPTQPLAEDLRASLGEG